jgi:hypothetical protein
LTPQLFSSLRFSLGLVAFAALVGCSAAVPTSAPTTGSGGARADGGAGGTGGGAGATDGGAPAGGPSSDAGVTTAPGRYVTNVSSPGGGPCANVALTDLLNKIRTVYPELADIKTIYNPAGQTGDGSFIYPYVRTDGGFDIVFKRGLGDCPSGCTENDYRYFATDNTCMPTSVGHYHAGWGSGTCLTVDGTPMWNHPPPPDPLTVCDQDNAAQNVQGTYPVRVMGKRQPCVLAGAAQTSASQVSTIDATATMIVEQDPHDLTVGTVTFSGTGHPLVDWVPLPARFQRRRFDAAVQTSNLPNACPRENSVTARYDFENYQPGGIEVVEFGNDACASCKGSMSLTLSPAP